MHSKSEREKKKYIQAIKIIYIIGVNVAVRAELIDCFFSYFQAPSVVLGYSFDNLLVCLQWRTATGRTASGVIQEGRQK